MVLKLAGKLEIGAQEGSDSGQEDQARADDKHDSTSRQLGARAAVAKDQAHACARPSHTIGGACSNRAE